MNEENRLLRNLFYTALFLSVCLAVTLAILCSSISFITNATDEDLVDIKLGDDIAYNQGNVLGGVEFDNVNKTETVKKISLFKESYVNDSGEKIAESSNGDDIIIPGIIYSYRFRFHNVGAGEIEYNFSICGTSEEDEQSTIPIEFRVKDGAGAYILGSADEWVGIEDLDKLNKVGTLNVNWYSIYILEWKWDTGSTEEGDAFDTELGNAAMSADIELSMTISTVAYAYEGGVTSTLAKLFLDKNGNKNEHADIVVGAVVVALMAASVTTLTVWLVRRHKRKHADTAPDYYMYY